MSEREALEARSKAVHAKTIIEDPAFRDAFESVRDHLEAVALSCDPDDKEKAARVIISMQLLRAVRREIERQIEDGQVAEIQLDELEQKRTLFKFRR